MSPKHQSSFSCIQIITPRSVSSPYDGLFPSYLSTSEFDPVLYREELLRKSYLAKFPISSSARPDYLITIGRSNKTCSIISLEVKGREDKLTKSSLPGTFIAISGLVILLFLIMLFIYLSGFVNFFL